MNDLRFHWLGSVPLSILVTGVLTGAVMGLLSGCFESPEGTVAPGRAEPPPPAQPADDLERPSEVMRWLDANTPILERALAPDAVIPAPFEDLLGGDLSCIGDNLPAAPSGHARSFSGRTVFFGTQTVACCTDVRLIDTKGTEMASTVSDDLGRFAINYTDTEDSHLAQIELSQPGFHPVRHTATHPELAWVDGAELGVVSPSEVDLIELAAQTELDPTRGSVHVRLFDCVGESGVAGATAVIEGVDAEIYYVGGEYRLSKDLDATTDSSQFYVFNLDPGTYSMALWGFTQPNQESPVLLNRVVFDVGAGALTALRVYPE